MWCSCRPDIDVECLVRTDLGTPCAVDACDGWVALEARVGAVAVAAPQPTQPLLHSRQHGLLNEGAIQDELLRSELVLALDGRLSSTGDDGGVLQLVLTVQIGQLTRAEEVLEGDVDCHLKAGAALLCLSGLTGGSKHKQVGESDKVRVSREDPEGVVGCDKVTPRLVHLRGIHSTGALLL